jgi:hypothetical protein
VTGSNAILRVSPRDSTYIGCCRCPSPIIWGTQGSGTLFGSTGALGGVETTLSSERASRGVLDGMTDGLLEDDKGKVKPGSSGAGGTGGGRETTETGMLDGGFCTSEDLNCGSSQFSTWILGMEKFDAACLRCLSSSRCLGLWRDELGVLRNSCL